MLISHTTLSCEMRILIVEDDADKARELRDFVSAFFSEVCIDEVRSFNSALKALCNGSVEYKAMLLDMSMPNFEVGGDEPYGGQPENFAGRDLLMQMKMRRRSVPTIVVTMFDGFGEGESRVSIDDLGAQMRDSFSDFYVGHVYYSQAEDAWKSDLSELLRGLKVE